jgi:hypothetical protein
MHEYLGGSSGIEQRMDIHFADISSAVVAIGLTGKSVRGAGIVRSLRS